MSVSLRKGQKVNLTKDNKGLNRIFVGCGWDAVKSKGGFLGLGKKRDVDIDASAILLRSGQFRSKDDLVYFGNLRHHSEAVHHMGDNLTGAGDGDDEVIKITLNSVPSDVSDIIIVANIYDCENREQDFGLVDNAFIRIVNDETGEELCRYDMSNEFAGYTAVIFGKLYRKDNEWKFDAIGQGTYDKSLSTLSRSYS